MEHNPIIPKPLKRYKGSIILKFTWIDLAFLACFAILVIIIWAFMIINYWLKFGLTIIFLATPIFLTFPINNQKGYIKIYLWLKYLFSKKSYLPETLAMLNPYSKITNEGLIKLKSGSYLRVIELSGFNISLLQEREQFIRLQQLRNFIRNFGRSYNLIKCTLPANMKMQMTFLKKQLVKSTDEAAKKVLQENIKILKTLKRKNLNLVDKYFLIIQGSKLSIEVGQKQILMELRTAHLKPKIASKKLVKLLIENFYDLLVIKNEQIKDQKVFFGSSYLRVGNTYNRIIALTGYPNQAYLGWLSHLNFHPNISWTIKVEPYDQNKAIKKLDSAIKNLEVEVISAKKNSIDVQKRQYLEALIDLSKQVNANGEILNSTYTFIKIKASNMKELNHLTSDFCAELRGNNIKYSLLRNLQKEGLDSFLPKSTLSTKKITSLELSSLALSYAFPFEAETLQDPEGFYLGYTNTNNNIYFDCFHQDQMRTNSNIVILGTSGSGKSTTTLKLIKDKVSVNTKVIVIDPEREYKQLCEKLNGHWINFGSDRLSNEQEIIINPLQFFKNDTGEREMLSSHIQFLEQFFQTLFPEITLMELNILRENLIKLYEKKGINALNSHLKTNPHDFPLISDLALAIRKAKTNSSETKKLILQKLEVYFNVFSNKNSPEYRLWNGHTIFNAGKTNLIVLDTHSLNESGNKRLSNAQLFLLLKFVNAIMVQNKYLKEKKAKEHQKLMIVIDEAHLLIDEKQPFGLDFMYQMVKRARKYDALTMIATQNIRDFVGGSSEIKKKTAAIINTSQYSFLLGMNPGDIEDLDKLYQSVGGLTKLEKEVLSTARQGNGILTLGPKERKIIQIELSTNELNLLAH